MATHPQQFQGRMKRPEQITTQDHDFPPPPDFLLASDSQPISSTSNTSGPVPSSLFDEIQRGGFKLRKTTTDRDRSAPRIR